MISSIFCKVLGTRFGRSCAMFAEARRTRSRTSISGESEGPSKTVAGSTSGKDFELCKVLTSNSATEKDSSCGNSPDRHEEKSIQAPLQKCLLQPESLWDDHVISVESCLMQVQIVGPVLRHS